MCLGVWMSLLDLNLFSKNFCHITIKIPWLPSNILKNSQISIFQMRTLLTWSSSGWVLMIRKVLPSKSMSSEEHFSYLSCPHIFNISEDIYKFMKKCHPLVSYNENHHIHNANSDQEKSLQNSIKTLNSERNHQLYFDGFLVKAISIHQWKYILMDEMT